MYRFTCFAVRFQKLMLLAKFVFYGVVYHLEGCQLEKLRDCVFHTHAKAFLMFLTEVGGFCHGHKACSEQEILLRISCLHHISFFDQSGVVDLLGMCPVPTLRFWQEIFTELLKIFLQFRSSKQSQCKRGSILLYLIRNYQTIIVCKNLSVVKCE